ncbi:hypothetical protein PI125_g25015 [Phytophthora idaei]|nr:hypothetical protein PI125_g25015 [Phytophthora idaei]
MVVIVYRLSTSPAVACNDLVQSQQAHGSETKRKVSNLESKARSSWRSMFCCEYD